jgi:CO/xanthine dehydrogenase Mo-binding subunit
MSDLAVARLVQAAARKAGLDERQFVRHSLRAGFLTESASRAPQLSRCLIPRFDGAILSLEWKEAAWDKFVTGAPRPRTPSEQQYSDRKLRSRR